MRWASNLKISVLPFVTSDDTIEKKNNIWRANAFSWTLNVVKSSQKHKKVLFLAGFPKNRRTNKIWAGHLIAHIPCERCHWYDSCVPMGWQSWPDKYLQTRCCERGAGRKVILQHHAYHKHSDFLHSYSKCSTLIVLTYVVSEWTSQLNLLILNTMPTDALVPYVTRAWASKVLIE